MTAPAEDPRGGCDHAGGVCNDRSHQGIGGEADRDWFAARRTRVATPPAAGRGDTDSGGEAIEPGHSAESNGRRLKWFTDDELAAELARRRALDGTS